MLYLLDLILFLERLYLFIVLIVNANAVSASGVLDEKTKIFITMTEVFGVLKNIMSLGKRVMVTLAIIGDIFIIMKSIAIL